MTLALKIALRVIQRRVDAGEQLGIVLLDYPKMSAVEQEQVKNEILRSTATGE